MALVSPSKSLNLEFSGSILLVSISGWCFTTFFHHSILFIFSKWILISCWLSWSQFKMEVPKVHVQSSATTWCERSPYLKISRFEFLNYFKDWRFALESNFDERGLDDNVQVLATRALFNGDWDIDISQSLLPSIGNGFYRIQWVIGMPYDLRPPSLVSLSVGQI